MNSYRRRRGKSVNFLEEKREFSEKKQEKIR